MRIYIDNLDGGGLQEYTRYIDAGAPPVVERVLNAPSKFTATLCCMEAPPVERAYVVVADNANSVLFSGYITAAPVTEGTDAAAALVKFTALSDEWLLDQVGDDSSVHAIGSNASKVLQDFVARQSASILDAGGISATTGNVLLTSSGDSFSSVAGKIAGAGGVSYRVLNGRLNVVQLGAQAHVVHATKSVSGFVSATYATNTSRANDVTVTGESEPGAYFTDVFYADGSTSAFTLTHTRFGNADTVLVQDSFDNAALNTQVWDVADAGSYLSVTADGLSASGGNGYDGQSHVMLRDEVELGGSLVAEVSGVKPRTGSEGVLCGFVNGPVTVANCMAGIRIRMTSGTMIATALVDGAETGAPFVLTDGHAYTFRVRLYASEQYRVLQTYYAHGDGTQRAWGGDVLPSSLHVVCEVRDEGLASTNDVTVLCDMPLGNAPAVCSFALLDNVHFVGSIRSVALQQSGALRAVCRAVDGSERTLLLGIAGEGIDCSLTTTGVLSFFDGRIPAAGEHVVVTYRLNARAAARLQDAAQIGANAAMGLPGVARWKGRMLQPQARCSADCENAAAALLSVSVSADAALHGSCVVVQPQEDIWPGDALQLVSAEGEKQLFVRTVRIVGEATQPEALRYEIAFANEWAEGLTWKTSAAPAGESAGISPMTADTYVENLSAMQVLRIDNNTIQLDAGIDAPAGGGFEVRRRDAGFGSSVDEDLVLRSTTRSISIPRVSHVESYAVRMYDGSTPRRYSRFSSVIAVNVPTG